MGNRRHGQPGGILSWATTLDDERRYYQSTFRYFETSDRQFESPPPIQGRWKIDGIGRSEPILRKLYFDNAARILKWKPKPAADPVPASVAPAPAPAAPSPPAQTK